jgi:hypothetical protein
MIQLQTGSPYSCRIFQASYRRTWNKNFFSFLETQNVTLQIYTSKKTGYTEGIFAVSFKLTQTFLRRIFK